MCVDDGFWYPILLEVQPRFKCFIDFTNDCLELLGDP